MVLRSMEQSQLRQSPRSTREASKSDALLGVGDLAKLLGTSERFVRRLIAERRLPFHKVGKYVRFDPRDVDRWLAENRVDALG